MPRILFDKKLIASGIQQDTKGNVPGEQSGNMAQLAFTVYFKGGSNAGAVKIEAAHDNAFAGTWALLATVNWATDETQHEVQITGPHRAIRVRIATAIGGGGSVDVWGTAID